MVHAGWTWWKALIFIRVEFVGLVVKFNYMDGSALQMGCSSQGKWEEALFVTLYGSLGKVCLGSY